MTTRPRSRSVDDKSSLYKLGPPSVWHKAGPLFVWHNALPLNRDVWILNILPNLAPSEWHVLACTAYALRELIDGFVRRERRSYLVKECPKSQLAQESYQLAQFPLTVFFYFYTEVVPSSLQFGFYVFRHLYTLFRAKWYGAETLRHFILQDAPATAHGLLELCLEAKRAACGHTLFPVIDWLAGQSALPLFRLDVPWVKCLGDPQNIRSMYPKDFCSRNVCSISHYPASTMFYKVAAGLPWSTMDPPMEYIFTSESVYSGSTPASGLLALALVCEEEAYIQKFAPLSLPQDNDKPFIDPVSELPMLTERRSLLVSALPCALATSTVSFRACFGALRDWHALYPHERDAHWGALKVVLPLCFIMGGYMQAANVRVLSVLYWRRSLSDLLETIADVLDDTEMAAFAKPFAETLFMATRTFQKPTFITQMADALTHWLSRSTPSIQQIFVDTFWSRDMGGYKYQGVMGHNTRRSCDYVKSVDACLFHSVQKAVEKAGITIPNKYYPAAGARNQHTFKINMEQMGDPNFGRNYMANGLFNELADAIDDNPGVPPPQARHNGDPRDPFRPIQLYFEVARRATEHENFRVGQFNDQMRDAEDDAQLQGAMWAEIMRHPDHTMIRRRAAEHENLGFVQFNDQMRHGVIRAPADAVATQNVEEMVYSSDDGVDVVSSLDAEADAGEDTVVTQPQMDQ